MSDAAPEVGRRPYPWGYAVLVMIAVALFPLGFVFAALDRMECAFLATLLMGPTGLFVALVGCFRLALGHGRRYRSLGELTGVAFLVGVLGFFAG